MPFQHIKLVLFDLDGTFADTAPDLANALNKVRIEEGLSALPFEDIRPHVSHGGIALTKLGFNISPEHERFEPLRQRFLDHYSDNIAEHTTVFPGIDQLLNQLNQRDIKWGIVTNKPKRLTDPLMQALQLSHRAACIISGDTTPERKPHPLPILYACQQASCNVENCIYVGDAERDIEAGRRAATKTLIAMFGYFRKIDKPETWGADGMISSAMEILDWIE